MPRNEAAPEYEEVSIQSAGAEELRIWCSEDAESITCVESCDTFVGLDNG